mgnify:CR=1 FL=1
MTGRSHRAEAVLTPDTLATLLATAGGLGYTPGLPGTAGALAGLLLALGLLRLRRAVRIVALVLLVLLAMPICEYGARAFGGDNKRGQPSGNEL